MTISTCTTGYIWDLRNPNFDKNISNTPSPQIVDLPNTAQAEQGFSPDGRYLAIKTQKDFRLLSVPDFKLIKLIPAITSVSTDYGNISWSSDGHLVSTLVDGGITVWDIPNQVSKHYSLDYKIATVSFVNDGWFIRILDRATLIVPNSPDAFAFCTLYLGQCHIYEYPNHNVALPTPDGKSVLTVRSIVENMRTTKATIGIWSKANEEKYHLQSELDLSVSNTGIFQLGDFCPRSFSPNSKYLLSQCISRIKIIDREKQAVIQELENIQFFAWLPNSEYYVAITSWPLDTKLVLYKLGVDTPIDILPLQGIIDNQPITKWETTLPTDNERIIISGDGHSLLINLGLSAIIIPIEYK